MCFVWISEQTAIISLYSINWLVFITEKECVYCTVRTGSLNIRSTHTVYLYVLNRSQKKQRLLPSTAFFFSGEGPCSRCYGRTAALRLLVQPCDEDGDYYYYYYYYYCVLFLVMEHRWNETDRGKRKYSGEKPVPLPLCPP
jgi:hypothetical protein